MTNLREVNLRIEAVPLEDGTQLIDQLSEGEVPPQSLLEEVEEALPSEGVTEAHSEEATEAQVIEEVRPEVVRGEEASQEAVKYLEGETEVGLHSEEETHLEEVIEVLSEEVKEEAHLAEVIEAHPEEETEVDLLPSEEATEVFHHSEETDAAAPEEVPHSEVAIEKGLVEGAHLEEDLQAEEVLHQGLHKERVASQEEALPEEGLLEVALPEEEEAAPEVVHLEVAEEDLEVAQEVDEEVERTYSSN